MRAFSPILALLVVLQHLVLASATCSCNSANGRMAARTLPFSVSAPSQGNLVLDVATLTSQLLAGSMGLPHKMAMVFVAMNDAIATLRNTSDSIPSVATVGYEVLARVLKSEPEKIVLLEARMKALGIERGDKELAGIAMKALMKHPLSPATGTAAYKSVNPASDTYDATCSTIQEADKWQPQCIQVERGGSCMQQKVPFVPLRNASLVSFNGERAVHRLIRTLPAPPSYNGTLSTLSFKAKTHFAEQYRRVLAASAALDDKRKFIAEFFVPNAAWQVYNVALEEAIVRNLTPEETLRMLHAVSAATRDAAVAAVTTKLLYSSARPLSVIQCAWGQSDVSAWRGPYMGVGRIVGGWRPYLQTPPHPGYVSGHAAVATAGMRVLELFFKDDVVRGANCVVQKAGMSKTEPRIEKGSFGYISGITDVPNTGSWTKGYSPAKDVSLCWSSFTEFRTMIAETRTIGGIHIPADNWLGVELGKRVAQFAYDYTVIA